MSKAVRFQDLEVWQSAHLLTVKTYRLTGAFPSQEQYGLVSQMRRAAVSVPANIAEGFNRRGSRDKIHFYNISLSSLAEVEYFVILSRDLGYLEMDSSDFDDLIDKTGRMLNALILSIERK